MPWAVAAAGVTAGAGLLGSSMQANAVGKGSREASLAQLIALDRTRGDLAPYMGAGTGALPLLGQASGMSGEDNALFDRNTALRMSGVLGPEAEAGMPVQNIGGQLSGIYGPEAAGAAMGNFFTSPGYQFRMEQGLRAIDAGAAKEGMLRSGATLKAEQAYGQGLASQEYNNYLANARQGYGDYYGRADDAFGNYYNRLFGLAKLGQASAAGAADAGQTSANAQSNIATGAAGQQSGIIGNAAEGLGRGVNQLMGNQQFQTWLGNQFAPSYTGNPAGYQTSPGLQFQAPNAAPIGF